MDLYETTTYLAKINNCCLLNLMYWTEVFLEDMHIVHNKIKGKISKRVLQGNKHAKFSENENFLPPDRHTGLKILIFRKIWRALFSCNTRFEIHLFVLLSTISASPINSEKNTSTF